MPSKSKSRSRSRKSASRKRSSKPCTMRAKQGSAAAKGIVVPQGISSGRAKYLVWRGYYVKTRSGLTKKDLMINDACKVVSKKKYQQGKKLQKQYPYDDPNNKAASAFRKYAGHVGHLKY